MSLTPEENKTPDTQEEESTIFGASPVREEKRKTPKKHKMLKTALSAFLVLLFNCFLLGTPAEKCTNN